MSIQTEKSILFDLLQNINDVSLLKKVKSFVLTEIEPLNLTQNQKNDSNSDAFEFLDNEVV